MLSFFRKKQDVIDPLKLQAFKQQLQAAAIQLIEKFFADNITDVQKIKIVEEALAINESIIVSVFKMAPAERQVWLHERLLQVCLPKIDSDGKIINGNLWELSKAEECLAKLESVTNVLLRYTPH